MKTRLCLALILALFSASSFAEWTLNSNSKVTFISIKADQIGETHYFSKLSGNVSSKGEVQLAIDLASLETNIPIRNTRMLEFLFEIAKFPSANISAQIDPNKYQSLNIGEQATESLPVTIDLHGKAIELSAKVSVTKLAKNQISVSSVSPVILSAAAFDLVSGIDKLQSLAGLSSISKAVPVSFSLLFDL